MTIALRQGDANSERTVSRVLVAYEKVPGEDFVGEWPLKSISLTKLQTLFGIQTDDPLYCDCYAVGPEQAEGLRGHVEHEIDTDASDYFVEAYRESGRH